MKWRLAVMVLNKLDAIANLILLKLDVRYHLKSSAPQSEEYGRPRDYTLPTEMAGGQFLCTRATRDMPAGEGDELFVSTTETNFALDLDQLVRFL
jgi:hypothetical protein